MTTTWGSRGKQAAGDAADHASGAAGEVRERKSTLGRVGLVGKGVVWGLIGVLATQLARGDAAEADAQGAVGWVASQSYGKFLLVALTVSLFALALWLAIEVFTGDPVEGDGAKERVKFGVSALIYGALAVFSLSATINEWDAGTGESGGEGGSGSQSITSTVFEWPAGRWLVGLAGLALIGGAAFVVKYHVIDKTFAERLRVARDHWAVRLGQVGYGARCVVVAIVGVFVVQTAVSYDPSEAKGLSESLKELSGGGLGQAVLWFVALGLIAYGLYCFAESYYRRAA